MCDRSTIVYVQIRKVLANNERCCHIRMTLDVYVLRNGRSSVSIVRATEFETERARALDMVIIIQRGIAITGSSSSKRDSFRRYVNAQTHELRSSGLTIW